MHLKSAECTEFLCMCRYTALFVGVINLSSRYEPTYTTVALKEGVVRNQMAVVQLSTV